VFVEGLKKQRKLADMPCVCAVCALRMQLLKKACKDGLGAAAFVEGLKKQRKLADVPCVCAVCASRMQLLQEGV
jgi:hypothetical protein